MKSRTCVVFAVAVVVWAVSCMAGGSQQPLPEFALRDLRGKVHRLSDYRGEWVIVNYWATSCPPCRNEIPELSKFYKQHKGHDAVVLGLDFEDMPVSWLREFVKETHCSYPILRAGTHQPTPFGRIMVLPTTFVVSPQGKVVAWHVGGLTAAALNRYLAERSALIHHRVGSATAKRVAGATRSIQTRRAHPGVPK